MCWNVCDCLLPLVPPEQVALCLYATQAKKGVLPWQIKHHYPALQKEPRILPLFFIIIIVIIIIIFIIVIFIIIIITIIIIIIKIKIYIVVVYFSYLCRLEKRKYCIQEPRNLSTECILMYEQ